MKFISVFFLLQLLGASVASANASKIYVKGTFQRLIMHPSRNDSSNNPTQLLYLRTSDNKVYELVFKETPYDITTGSRGWIKGSLETNESIIVDEYFVQKDIKTLSVSKSINEKKNDISSIAIIHLQSLSKPNPTL